MMKTLNKLAAIALLISTGQTFAGDSFSANLHTTEPGNLQASAMEIMSADELSAVRETLHKSQKFVAVASAA